MTSLADATALTEIAADTFQLRVGAGWEQGRGAFGGLVLAAMTRAAERCEPGRPLRSVTAELAAPVTPGVWTLRVRKLRIGSGMSTLSVELGQSDPMQGAPVAAHAVFVMGKARAPGISLAAAPAPHAPRASDTPIAPMDTPGMPVFTQHFEFRVLPPYPFTAHQRGAALGYVRARKRGDLSSSATLVALADVWFPSLFTALAAPCAVATVAYTLSLAAAMPVADEPLLHHGQTLAVNEGHAIEQRCLYDSTGRLLCVNQQTFAILG